MHDRGVRPSRLAKDAAALGSAFRLLTDARDGPALLRDVASSLSREFRQVGGAADVVLVAAFGLVLLLEDAAGMGRGAGCGGGGGE